MPRIVRWRPISLLACLALSAVVAACSDSSGPDSVAGTYTLRSVNQMPLPYLIANETSGGFTFKVEVISGNIALKADNTFTTVGTVRQTLGSTVSTDVTNETGTYTISGSALTLTLASGEVTPATLTGGTITLVTQGVTLVFGK